MKKKNISQEDFDRLRLLLRDFDDDFKAIIKGNMQAMFLKNMERFCGSIGFRKAIKEAVLDMMPNQHQVESCIRYSLPHHDKIQKYVHEAIFHAMPSKDEIREVIRETVEDLIMSEDKNGY